MLDQAFDALKTYDWGADAKVLQPIDDAIIESHGDAKARQQLEKRLLPLLESGSQAAKDFVFRKLRVIGTAVSVPALASLLGNAKHNHMARYALESMPASEAGDALRGALSQLSGPQLVGVVSSLGVRADTKSVSSLAKLLNSDDATVANAAAHSLGCICTGESAKALASASGPAATDASLACAEGLLASGDKIGALSIYKRITKDNPPKHVKLAATRGMLACAGK